MGYNIRKVNSKLKFKEQVELNFNEEIIKSITTHPTDGADRMFNSKLESCCKRAISKRKVANKMVPWNKQLT